MEFKKVKILLEDFRSRDSNYKYGQFTADTINVNVFLEEEIKDMGTFINHPYVEYNKLYPLLTYQPIPQKLMDYGGTDFNFLNNPGSNFNPTGNRPDVRYRYKTNADFWQSGVIVSGITEERLESVSSYGYIGLEKYVSDFDLNKNIYQNYLGNTVNGVTRILSINDFKPIIYTEDGDLNDPNLGTVLQSNGILFKTYTGTTNYRTLIAANRNNVNNLTMISYQGQAYNKTNTSLSALTIEEYLLHITEKPKVDSDLFIDRGGNSVLQSHLQLAEIVSLDELVNYGNGYYNLK
jgi:hypothetical protein